MPRFLTLLIAALPLGGAFFLYAVKYDTRQLEARIQADERAIEQARNDIAVLKAERAHLSRPERIEPLARALGLAPPQQRQVVSGDSLDAQPAVTSAPAGARPGGPAVPR